MVLAKTRVMTRNWHVLPALAAFACGPAGLPELPVAKLPACSAALGQGIELGADDSPYGRLCLPRAKEGQKEPVGELLPADSDLSLGGYKTVGPAVRLMLRAPLDSRGADITLPVTINHGAWSASLDEPRQRARMVVLSRFSRGAVHVTPVENIAIAPPLEPGGRALLRFHLPGHGIVPIGPAGSLAAAAVFQVAVPEFSGTTVKRRLSYRAIAGVSMGGLGASINFFRHLELYDAIGVMGADPGPDLTYTQGFSRDFLFGGFCPPDGKDAGCLPARSPLGDQGELTGTFESMPVQIGEGIGLTLRRSLYLRANRDLVRALGNWASYNPQDPYLPAGVPAAALTQPPEEACEKPVVLPGKARDAKARPFYDGRYNRDGRYDVITFCDGGEADGKPGVFDSGKEQRDPPQILLAVDLNGNGRRDLGEPVIFQSSEPFRDVGRDGLASGDEPGYDPVVNPDPAGDDYHYLKNPGGTEGNWRYDQGEPYFDVGIDGVAGGCEIDSGQLGCFDYGEGNRHFDHNPGMVRWLEHDPHTLAEQLPAESLSQRDIYYDAGLRDFFNAHVSTSALFGVLAERGLPVRLYGGFPALVGRSPADEATYDASSAPFAELGSPVFVRYGNLEVSEETAARTGNGRHTGSPAELVQRAVTLFSYLLSRWPDADRSLQPADDPRLLPKSQSFMMTNGRTVPYGIILPPGYFEAANQDVRYPVIYIGHGYGMAPQDLGKTIGSLIHGFMSDPDPARRLAKAVLVFVDAKCRPGGNAAAGPLPAEGDLCEEGAFYTEHPAGTYKGETLLRELDAHLRRNYRLREPAEISVPF